MDEKISYRDKAPYPPVKVCGRNSEYAAAMVDNIGACSSEMSAVSLYFYNSLITKGAFPEIAECFHGISIVEMHHLDIFGELALMLGADPRLWHCKDGKMVYWTPECNRYPDRILILIENALNGELGTIEKYKQQMEWIKDEHIAANLARIIKDEELHVELFKEMYRNVSGRDCHIKHRG